MNKLILALLAATVLPFSAAAQEPAGSLPATTNTRYAGYPKVAPDGRVTFQIAAPAALRVQLIPLEVSGGNGLGKGPFDLIKDAKGNWSLTVPATPGFHYYSFLVDGALVSDPGSESFFGMNRSLSGVEVPEPGVDIHLPKAVPHGDVRTHWYFSRVTNSWRRVHLYLPPGYDADARTRYPVLYLQHGGGEDDSGWVRQGRMNFLLDNLLAEKKARPMIVVMDSGYAYNAADAPIPGERPDLPAAPPNRFAEVVVKDLVPMIDATYRTRADRDHRAIAGLSMGSRQVLDIAFEHPELFSWVGAFSCGWLQGADPYTAYNGIWKNAAAFNKNFHLFYLSAGTVELHHNWIPQLHQKLTAMGVHNIYYESAGTAHEWLNWRRSFRDFAQRLF